MTLVNAINLKTGDVAEFDLINIKTSGNYKGLWDASTNTPFLTNGVGTEGDWYEVSVGGTVNFGAGDFVFSEGDTVSYIEGKWEKASEKIIDDSQISYNKTWSSAKIKEEIDIQVPLIVEEKVEEKLEEKLSGKQDLLTEDQLKAVNSGITAEKVADYDGLSTDINNLSTEVATNKTDIATLKTDMGDIGDSITDLRNDKQDKLTETQLQAVDSGITSEKVLEYDTAVSELAELKQEVTDIDGMVAENGAEINALKTDKNDVFQVSTVPLLTDVVPNPFQYIGETEGGFIKGHFYEKTETDFTQWERTDNQTYVVTMADAVVGDGVYQADGKTMIGTITEISYDSMTYTDTDEQSVSTTYHSVFHSTGFEEVYDFESGAKDITYSNTESGLSASNVQDAIDEVDVKVNETQDDIKDLIDTKNDLSQYDVIKVKNKSPNFIELNKEYIGCLKLATDYNVLDIISKNVGLADDTEVTIAKISYSYNNVDYEKILKLRYKVSNTAVPYYVFFTDLNGEKTELILFDMRNTMSPTIRSINILSDMGFNFKITEFNSIAELELKDILKVNNIQSVFVDEDKDAIIKNFNQNSTNYLKLGTDIAVGNYGPIAVQNGYNLKSQGIIFNLPNGKVLQLSYSDENGLALKPFSTLSAGPNIWGNDLLKLVTLGSAITDMNSLPTNEFLGNLIKMFDVPASATNQPEGLTIGGYCVWTGNASTGHNQTKCVGTLIFYPLTGGIYFKTFYGWTGSLKASSNWQKITTTIV